MKSNIGLRFLGCIGVLLIAVGVFLPYLGYSGYTISMFENVENLYYFPYVILGFCAISLLVLLINKKPEISYILIGMCLTFDFVNTMQLKENFKFFSYGYYMMVSGPLLLLICLLLMPSKKEESLLSESSIRNNNSDTNKNNNINDNYFNSIDNSYNNISSGYNNINNNYNAGIQNGQPSQFAESIMNQPVMKDNLNNSYEKNQSLSSLDREQSIDTFDLAPENPLTSFLPNDLVLNNLSNTNIDNYKSVNDTKQVPSQDNSVQSILTIMEQPMVGDKFNQSVSQTSPQVIPEQPVMPHSTMRGIPEQPVMSQPTMRGIPEK